MKRVAVVLVALVLLCVGMVAGLLLAPRQAPDSLASAEPPEAFPVAEQEFTDERSIGVAVTYGPDRSLTSNLSGVITRSACVVGESVASGDDLVDIDGVPIIALATAVPLWRDLYPGMKGEDVSALRAELSRLDLGVDPGSTMTTATVNAFKKLVEKAGGKRDQANVVSASAIVWLPSQAVTAVGCPVAKGTRIAPDGVLATLPPDLLSAVVSPLPEGLAQGDRVLSVDDETFAVDEQGALAPKDLERFAATKSVVTARTLATNETVAAVLSLTTPVSVYPVPPRAVLSDGTAFCVVDGETVVPVDLLASELGQAFVRPLDASTSLSEVVLSPSADATCG